MIYVLLADGCEEIEALTPVDILRRGGCEVRTVGITGSRVTGSHGIRICADILPDEAADPIDLLILPGGIPGADHLDASPDTERLIRRTLDEGGRLAAICAAPYILGKRGLLSGKKATCYPSEKFRSQLAGAEICDCPVVTDGHITTGAGMGAAFAFSVELLSLMAGKEIADKIATGALIGPACKEP